MADGDSAVDLVMREWAKGHEAVCAERARNIAEQSAGIKSDISELRSSISVMSKTALGVLIAMVGWLAVQVYDHVENSAAQRPVVYQEHQR